MDEDDSNRQIRDTDEDPACNPHFLTECERASIPVKTPIRVNKGG